jgi:predicted phosphoribosyltransferase
MRFRNRDDAAARLAARLAAYRGRHPLVLGVPRGAVPMARVIADALDGDLDVVLVRKLRAPGQPELAIGAVDESGAVVQGRYFDQVPDEYVREELRTQMEMLRARRERYTRARPAVERAGRIVIVVDDGIATGSSMLSALRAVRAGHPARLVAAVAVAPPRALDRIAAEADEVVCLHTTDDFLAVGQFFADFSEVTDDMVVAALTRLPATARSGR